MEKPTLIDAIFQFLFDFRSQLSQDLAHAGLGSAPMHMKILKLAKELPDATAQHIAQYLKRDKAQINRVLQEMISKGYVSKTQHPNDKRSQLLQLTAEGESVLQQMAEIEHNLITRMCRDIPQQDIAHFIDLTERFRDNL